MSKFLTRVILHDAPDIAAYDGLNDAMAQLGFARELPGKKNRYHLPHGDYWYQGNANANDLRLMASTAGQTTGLDYGVLVVRIDGWSLMRLKKVAPAPQS